MTWREFIISEWKPGVWVVRDPHGEIRACCTSRLAAEAAQRLFSL